MKELLNQISELNPNAANILVTGVEGPLAGQKLLISDKKIVYATGDAIKNMMDLALATTTTKKVEADGSTFFCEVLGTEKKIVICGAGYVSMPVIKIAKMLGFHVTVIEDRPSFADNARRAGADKVLCENFATALDTIEGDKDTFFVIVTRGHRYDIVCLEKILPKPNAYIGMIGSKLRVRGVLETVGETLSNHPKYKDGGEESLKEALNNVYSPIGLDIKAETPEEIGVAIIGEIIGVKNGKAQTSGFSKEMLKGVLSEDKNDMGKVLCTIITRKGSTPRGAGTKMLLFQDGSSIGTIGGGCAEADIRGKSILLMNEKTPKIYKVDMTGREAEDDGMVCGGIIEVLLEPFH